MRGAFIFQIGVEHYNLSTSQAARFKQCTGRLLLQIIGRDPAFACIGNANAGCQSYFVLAHGGWFGQGIANDFG